MNVEQCSIFLNDALAQSIGSKAIANSDLSNLVSVGNVVMSSSTDLDKFLGVLTDRIGKVVLRNLDLQVNYPNIIRNGFEFGAALEKISIQPLQVQDNTAWEIGAVGYTPSQFAISKGACHVSIFRDVDTWKVRITIPDDLFKTAFTSASEMGSFIDGLINSLTESMTLALNRMNQTCINNYIAQKVHDDVNVVHLLAGYNLLTGQTYTADDVMHDKEFYKYACQQILNQMRYMNEPNVCYNQPGAGIAPLVRRTARDNMHVFMLSEFFSGSEAYLSADTFHNELTAVNLPLFQPVTAWQDAWGDDGQGNKNDMPDFQSASTINVKTVAGDSVNQDYIVCALIDREAVGTTMYDIRSSSVRNDEDGYTNLAQRATVGYFNDFSEQGCVFVID